MKNKKIKQINIEELTGNQKDIIKGIIFGRLEKSQEHNIFNNYNCYSRDHQIFEETFNECFDYINKMKKTLLKEMKYNSYLLDNIYKYVDDKNLKKKIFYGENNANY